MSEFKLPAPSSTFDEKDTASIRSHSSESSLGVESVDTVDSGSIDLEGLAYRLEAVKCTNDLDLIPIDSKESVIETEDLESVRNDHGISDNPKELSTTAMDPEYRTGEDHAYDIVEVEAAKIQTMFTNLNMYLAQVMTYFGLLAALYACGNDIVRYEIRKGVCNLVILHQILFGESSELGEENRELKTRIQGLEQDNYSWKALFRIEADRWSPRYRKAVEVIRRLKVQEQEAETVIAKKETEVKHLTHAVLALESKNVDLKKNLAVSQDLVSSLKQETPPRVIGRDLLCIGEKAVDWLKKMFLVMAYDVEPLAKLLLQFLPKNGSLKLIRYFDEIITTLMDPSYDLIQSLQPLFSQYSFPARFSLENRHRELKQFDEGETEKDINVPRSKLNEVTKDRDVAVTQLFEIRAKDAVKQARIYELEAKIKAENRTQGYREGEIRSHSGEIIIASRPKMRDTATLVETALQTGI